MHAYVHVHVCQYVCLRGCARVCVCVMKCVYLYALGPYEMGCHKQSTSITSSSTNKLPS